MSSPDQLQLDRVVFYGRSLAEYELFLNLDRQQLSGLSILDCPAGTASFAAEATSLGARVVSVDPVYRSGFQALKEIATRDIEHTLKEVERIKHVYTWKFFENWETMRASRFQCLNLFLEDFRQGVTEGRYLAAALPTLPFQDNSFDLVLSSHLLFIYSDQLDDSFQIASLRELVRVARKEVRLFPTSLMNRQPFPKLDAWRKLLAEEGILSEVIPSRHEFVRGWNTILVLKKNH